MHSKFLAVVVSAAIAVTTLGTTPARADEDLFRALAAIAGVAIVGKVISDRNKRKKEEERARNEAVTRSYTPEYVYRPQPRGVPPQHRIEPRPLPRQASRYLLPGECLRNVQARDGRYRFFGRKCLEKNYGSVRNLPDQCRVRFDGPERKRAGYDARCLRSNGYQLARR